MVQIEQHLKRRDQELQELLKILNRTYDIVERRAIKERSSVVIIAICVLMTSYESLQVCSFIPRYQVRLLTSGRKEL
jgi:hypothetical protein